MDTTDGTGEGNDASPTWAEFTALLMEGTHLWLPDELASELQAYLNSAGHVFFALVASPPPSDVVDVCIQANRSCLQVCVEGVEALGGLDLKRPSSEHVFELTQHNRLMFEEIVAPMSAAAVAAVVAKYDQLSSLLAAMDERSDIRMARGILRMITACNDTVVAEIAHDDRRRRNEIGRVGTPRWKRAQKRWAETGKW